MCHTDRINKTKSHTARWADVTAKGGAARKSATDAVRHHTSKSSSTPSPCTIQAAATNANAAVGTTTRAPHANQFQDRAATSGSMADADAAKYAELQHSEAKWCCGPGRYY
jgi:hypothetical protein